MKKSNRSCNKYIFWLVIAIIFAFIGLLSPFIPKLIFNVHQYSELANFGDWYGGTSAMFIAMGGIILLVINFYMQKEELSFTRAEFTSQNETLSLQRFENTFFHLLKCYNDLVYNMDIDTGTSKKNGRDCFGRMYSKLQKGFPIVDYKTMDNDKSNELREINNAYKIMFEDYKNDLGNYFRTLYHIVKHVDETPFDYKTKRKYTNIIRAQLSTYELALLFYNCLSNYGNKKFKPYIETYQLVKNMPKKILIKERHISFYNNLVFEEDEEK